MKGHAFEDRVLALAGVFQAARLVDQTAWTGRQDETERDVALGSLFVFEAADVPQVFGGVRNLRTGLESLARMLGAGGDEQEMRAARYVVSLLAHARTLGKRPELMSRLREGLERAAQQKSHFEHWDTHVLSSLADLYSTTIGTLEPRIMVRGEPARLENPETVKMVRALLLAGIRAAFLWEQTGGSRWTLLFKRRRLVDTARGLAAQL
ncbi:MAG: high frequency lysogenization protein HflD [Gammaproteobacteria bacterium]|nr:high frequency lysogenization protein HflD [Gammaproteobacteria bacterium]